MLLFLLLAQDKFYLIRIDMVHVEDAIINIQNHQAHLLDTSVIQSHSEWFQYLPNSEDMGLSRFNCHFCSRYRKEFFIMEKSEFDDKEGVLKATKRENHQAIKNHAKSAGHQKTMDIYERRMAAGIFEDLAFVLRASDITVLQISLEFVKRRGSSLRLRKVLII